MNLTKNVVDSDMWLNFDLSGVTERFRLKSPYGSLADELEFETRRFLRMSVKTGEPVVPSVMVDEYWHALILDTRTYKDFCQKAFGVFVEHANERPRSTSDAVSAHAIAYASTLDLYYLEFGEWPDGKYWPKLSSRLPERLSKYKFPYRLHLETTNHCNLRCEHCYPESSSKNPHHDRNVIYRVLNEAKLVGVGKITLTGGELLTRPDWKEVFSKALDTCDNVYFITNGLLLTKKKMEWLVRQRSIRSLKKWRQTFLRNSPVEIGVAISLDGLYGNELVRKNDAGVGVKATQIIESIRLAVQYGLHVTVNTTISNELSASELPEMYRILKDIGIDRWQLDQAYLAGRMIGSDLEKGGLDWLETAKNGYAYIVKDYLKDYPSIPEWRLEIVQVFRYDNLFYGFYPAVSLDEHPCSYHFGSMIVEEGDKVRFCPSLRDSGIRGISEAGSIAEVYKEENFKEFMEKSISDLPCKDCRYGRLFHGGCRANSLSYTGEMWGADPICCSLSPFVEDEIVPLLPQKCVDSFYASLQGGPRPGELGHLPTQKKPKRVIPLHPI